MTASSAAATPSTNAAPSASETAAALQKLLKRTRKHRQNERDDASRLDELRRLFAGLVGRGELVLRGAGNSSTTKHNNNGNNIGADDDAEDGAEEDADDTVQSKWNAYLSTRHGEFLDQLSTAVQGGRKTALRTFCGVIASTPRIEKRRDGGEIQMVDERLLQDLIDALISSSGGSGSSATSSSGNTGSDVLMDEAMLDLFDSEFLRPHRDVQYFALVAIRQLAGEIYQRNSGGKSGSNGKGKGAGRKDKDEEAGRDGQRAENLLRILLRIDIAASDEELASGETFLIAQPPPFTRSDDGGSSIDDKDDTDDEEDNDDGEDNGSSEEEESGSSDEDDNYVIGRKRKRKGNASASSKKARGKRHRPTWQQATKHRRALQEAWLAVLKIPTLPNRALKRALQHLPTAILPVVSAPLRFADVCTRSYEVGGVTSLLALHSLFVLMMDHGLEYPQFYASLYRLVTPRNFYAKHRTRFFRLLTSCLSKSDMLPAYVVAAFCKKLCRCALTAPASGALFVLALVSNLLRRHGECACLVHRSGGTAMEDKYDVDAQDPAQSRALESSLWELAALGRHFHPAVAGLAKSVGTESDTTPMHDMDEFLLHTYKSLFETERKRMADPSKKSKQRQKAVPVTFEKPKGLFASEDVFAGILSVPGNHEDDDAS